ncbi:hypothetical protein, partial [Janthinobacterium sp. AD80]|uniref:hypothetical protein n=1 Tax=Janthinobacterium sp. AD80 TaxID=1528773 RepID=UPI001CA52057
MPAMRGDVVYDSLLGCILTCQPYHTQPFNVPKNGQANRPAIKPDCDMPKGNYRMQGARTAAARQSRGKGA